jgi:hypothetical protein
MSGRVSPETQYHCARDGKCSLQFTWSGIAFFRALANNAASSGEATSAKDCGDWTAHGSWSRLDHDHAAADCLAKETEPAYHSDLTTSVRQTVARLVSSGSQDRWPWAI